MHKFRVVDFDLHFVGNYSMDSIDKYDSYFIKK